MVETNNSRSPVGSVGGEVTRDGGFMTFGTSAFQRENGRQGQPSAPATIGSAVLRATPDQITRAPMTPQGTQSASVGVGPQGLQSTSTSGLRPRVTPLEQRSASAPMVTWVGPMEVMMEGCRYRLVPADGAANHTGGSTGNGGTVEPLTPRETQIARLVADGLVNKEIATKLSISEWTVSTHMRRIFAKLGVETRAAMVLRCFGAKQ